jgi:O-antigen/teichoic acid export membrane protein
MRHAKAAIANFHGRIAGLLRKDFVRHVGVLAGGTAFAQALTVLVLPILTRLYTPAHFSVLAVYVSLLGILSVAACLRFEFAIPMPERDEDAVNLLALALTSATVLAALVAITVWSAPDVIARLVHQPALRPYLWMLPLGLWLAGSYAAFQYWATRKRKFTAVAQTRLTQAIGGSGTQIALGWAGLAPLGLLLGQTISVGAGVFGLGRAALRNDRGLLRFVDGRSMRRMFREYDRFPKYSTFDGLANTIGIQLPVIIIAALAIGPEAGYLMLATRTMAAPMTLVGGSVAQVYLSRAPEELRSGRLATFSIKVLTGLAKTGVGPLLFAGIVAPAVFPFVFGKDWQRAGEIVAWMTPWFILQFISSPISMVMHVCSRQKAMLCLTVSGLIIRLGALWIAGEYARRYFAEAYAISGGIFYFLCLLAFSRVAGVSIKQLMILLRGALPALLVWATAGVIAKVALGMVRS